MTQRKRLWITLQPTLAVLFPWVVFLIQWLMWPLIRPMVWILFYPTMFLILVWFGHLMCAKISFFLAAFVEWYFFAPPAWSFMKEPKYYISLVIFVGLSLVLMSIHSKSQEMKKRGDQVREFVESILENIPDMIFVKDSTSLKFVRLNRAAEELLGFPKEALLGKSDFDLFPKDQATFFTEQDRATLDRGTVLEIAEEPIQTKYRGQRILHTKKIPIFDDRGEPEYLLGISEDITEKKELETLNSLLFQSKVANEEAQKSIRLRDDFISMASHELKTPITALKMQLQMVPKLLEGAQFHERERLVMLFERSLLQLDQFSSLADKILDASRIAAGRLTLEKSHTPISAVIENAINQCQSDLAQAGCELRLCLESSLVGYLDFQRMVQVVVNLLSNAIKYGAGRPIELSSEKVDSKARIRVRDYGIGISREDQNKIFERFERASSVKNYRGLGLGLYISQQIIQAHHGDLRVKSDLGKGSEFLIEIPLN